MKSRAVCIHGHFYQPPREHPVSGRIPREPGAAPFQNWNEKIHAECYARNAELGNFGRISHNIGPTLARWIAQHDPETYESIVAQGRGGAAMAQSYNHTILPLASRHDRETQVIWGIEDYKFRYGRSPRGMWLPETAADSASLEVLAENGIEFTILAPWQAAAEDLDVTQPYRVRLGSGRSIVVFFYQGPISGHVSFSDRATENADAFLNDLLLPAFNPNGQERQLVMIATDGELYGHHKKHREHFLSYVLTSAARDAGIEPVLPAEWIDRFPVHREIRIVERTSWSCHHGVARWSTGCDCTSGDPRWKKRLRRSMEELARRLDDVYVDEMQALRIDPWELRNGYVHVMLGQQVIEELIADVARIRLSAADLHRVSLLMRAQRMRQYMMTSCGWFFAGLGLEATNNLLYAREAVRLTALATGIHVSASRDLEPVRYLDVAA